MKVYKYFYTLGKEKITVHKKEIECEETEDYYIYNEGEREISIFKEAIDRFDDFYAYSLDSNKEKEFLVGVDKYNKEIIFYIKEEIKRNKKKLKLEKRAYKIFKKGLKKWKV